MRVALGTTYGHPHPNRPRCRDPVNHRVKPIFERIDTTFFVQHGVAMKSSCNFLIFSRIGKHISGQLLYRKLVKWHVFINRLDDPITVRPNRSGTIFFITICVCVSSQIKPNSCPTFTIRIRLKQLIDNFLIRIGRLILHERVSLIRGRRQANQIKIHSTDQRVLIG